MKVKDLKMLLNNFDDECPVKFEDKEGLRHKITNARDDRCLLFWTLILSEQDIKSQRNGQIIIWRNHKKEE